MSECKRSVVLGLLSLGLWPATASAINLYGPDGMTNGASWNMAVGGDGDVAATFGYDYSADGIPAAPHGADTLGVKLEANNSDFVDAGAFFTLSPNGLNLTGTYQLRFDAWMNFDADERAGASVGTTEFLGGGVGYDGVTADIASGVQAIATGDGGSGSDWRVFKSPPQFFVPATGMAGGSRNGNVSYYSDFLPAVAPPASQGQSASGIAGSPGFQWITWVFTSINTDTVNKVFVDIEKPDLSMLRIADIDGNDTSDGSSGAATEGNISLFYADFFSSVTPRPDLTFGIIDNVVVTDVPEPTSLTLLLLGGTALMRRRRQE